MAFPGPAGQAGEVVSKLILLISNQKVKKKFLCQREQEQRANKPVSYTMRAGSCGVTGPFHLRSRHSGRWPCSQKARIFMTPSGYCIALITHHSSWRGLSQRQAESLNAKGDIREPYSRSLASRSKLSPSTCLSFPHNPA